MNISILQDLVAVEQGGWKTTSTIKYWQNILIISIVQSSYQHCTIDIYMLLLLIARIRVAVNRSQMKVTCSALNSFFQDAIQVMGGICIHLS